MCSVLVLGPVRGVGEGFGAPLEFTDVWPLSGVGAQVSLEILQTRVGLLASLKLSQETNGMVTGTQFVTQFTNAIVPKRHNYQPAIIHKGVLILLFKECSVVQISALLDRRWWSLIMKKQLRNVCLAMLRSNI